ncbi:MAG: hypothetical protein ACLRR3_01760 [Eubacterium sp.]
MKKSKAKKNVVVGFTGQLIILLLGMVFPRVILKIMAQMQMVL